MRTSSDQDRLATVRAERRQLATSGPTVARSAGDFERVSLPDPDGDALRELLVAERATTVIEIGLGYGSSALAVGEALVATASNGARHVIIDAHQKQFQRAGWDAIVAAGLTDVCTLIELRSQVALPRLLDTGFVADAAFVDGSHIFHQVFTDLVYLRELVRPGGLVVLDDCDWLSVATATRYFEVNTGWQPVAIAEATRLSAFRLPDPPTEPDFRSFRPFGVDATS